MQSLICCSHSGGTVQTEFILDAFFLTLQEHENRRRKNLQWKIVEKRIENFLLHWKARVGLDTKLVSLLHCPSLLFSPLSLSEAQ